MTGFRAILFCAFICVLQFSFAQQTGNFIDKSQSVYIPFSITSYGTKHGLPQNQILDIIAKKDGELIISTANGIVEYNGSEFYDILQNRAYKKYVHNRLYWHEQTKHLYSMEFGGTFLELSPSYKTIPEVIKAYLDGDTIIGVNLKGELFKKHVKDKNFVQILKTNVKNPNSFYLKDKHVFITSDIGTFSFDIKTGKSSKLSNEIIYCFKENIFTKKLFAYSNTKLYEVNSAGLVEIDIEHPHQEFSITDIEFINDSEYFISTTKGLLFVTYGYIDHYDEINYLPTNFLQSLYFNKEENCLFVGTGNKGLLKLQFKNCSSLLDGSSMAKASLSSIIRNHEKKVLVAASDNLVYHIKMDTIVEYYKDKAGFSSMAEIGTKLYLGTWGDGVHIVENQQRIGEIQHPKLESNIVHSIFQDKMGEIWIGNNNGVSKGKNIQNIKPFKSPEIVGRIITIYEMSNGNLCLGGSEGVYILNQKREVITHLGSKLGLKCKEVRSFLEDKEGKLWIGTYDGGMYCYQNQKLTSINKKANSKLPIDVFTLAKDSRGYIYMSANNGLWVIHEKKLNDFYDNKLKYLVPFYYGNENGILNTEFNGGFQNNFLLTKMDHLYFPTIEGVLLVSSDDYNFRKLKPKIKNVRVNDTIIPHNFRIFERSTFSIEFDFYCPNFISKYNLHYQYKLCGPKMMNGWSPLQKNGNIRFSMLPPGEYTFQVRGVDAFNDDKPIVYTYKFEIKPYFYEMWWFWITSFIVFLLILIFIIRLRTYQLRIRERKENKINNTILELKLKAIQSKMNPHFIFNSLNNIIYLLNSERHKEAEDLLQDFSLLLRQFLESSDQTVIAIRDEFEILDLYLAIEQRRYNHSFSYTFEADNEVKELKIPTLLLQPIIENAVKHGVAHSNERCYIKIKAIKLSNDIEITITDNGIGRKKSEEINKSRKKHNSHGIGLVKQKIEIIKLKYNQHIELTIQDLNSSLQTGTVVTLKIPLND